MKLAIRARDAAVDGGGREALSAYLRRETRNDHERVDAAFGRFDLGRTADYLGFLQAQARALPAVEAALRPGKWLNGWRGRTEALAADIRAMGGDVPAPCMFAAMENAAARWGGIYVLEGSRLGGAFLARSIAPGWPCAFLGAGHGPGTWRELLRRLDEAGAGMGDAARQQALSGARRVFAAFAEAAGGR